MANSEATTPKAALAVRASAARASFVYGTIELSTAVLLAFGVFRGLPSRWLVVDVIAALLIGLKTTSAILLCLNRTGRSRVHTFVRAVALLTLASGLAALSLLAWSVSFLSGVVGGFGSGGAVIFALVGALLFPYLVVAPAAQLAWLAGLAGGEPAKAEASASEAAPPP